MEIEAYGVSRQLSFAPKLIYASKMAAKVDSSLIQSGYQIYQHNFLFTKSGQWAVIQQGMNINNQTARRYHWLSTIMKEKSNGPDFIEEPHAGIAAQVKESPLNLTAKISRENKDVSLDLVIDEPNKFIDDMNLIQTKREKNLTQMFLPNREFHWHKVLTEKFDLKRLAKTIFSVNSQKPPDFENMLSLKGVGPKTIRALSLVAEIIYGAKPSYEDPARYTFSVGGKDGTPYFVDRVTYDKTLAVIERGIKKSLVSLKEKTEAQARLQKLTA